MTRRAIIQLGLAILALIFASLACTRSLPGVGTAQPPLVVPQPTEFTIFVPSVTEGEIIPTPTSVPAPAAPQETGLHNRYFPAAPVNSGPPGQVFPRVLIQADPPSPRVGERLTIIGQPVDIGLPVYTLYVRDPGSENAARMALATYQNRLTQLEGESQIVELHSGMGEMGQVVFTLNVIGAGTVEVWIQASGEIHYGDPGAAIWGGGGSEHILVTVSG